MANVKVRKERSEAIMFFVSKEEKDAIVKMAKAADQTISDFCRKTLLASAREG